jgi:hypothetical protein
MLKGNYVMLKREIWITTKFTSQQGFNDLSHPNRTSCLAQSSQGASLGRKGNPGCTSYDDELDDDPFSFHTCLVDEVDFDVGDLSFTGSSSSFRSRFLWCWAEWRLLLDLFFFGCP